MTSPILQAPTVPTSPVRWPPPRVTTAMSRNRSFRFEMILRYERKNAELFGRPLLGQAPARLKARFRQRQAPPVWHSICNKQRIRNDGPRAGPRPDGNVRASGRSGGVQPGSTGRGSGHPRKPWRRARYVFPKAGQLLEEAIVTDRPGQQKALAPATEMDYRGGATWRS
jgi:hypothetical protein